MNNAISMRLAPISFYSNGDEKCLWEGLKTIPFVSNLQHIDAGRSFLVDATKMDWESFRDLMALDIRYDGDLNDLLSICPAGEVRDWFVDQLRDWHGRLRS